MRRSALALVHTPPPSEAARPAPKAVRPHAAPQAARGPDERHTTHPPSGKRPSGTHRSSAGFAPIDPLEEALLSRPVWDSREPEPAVHELLYRFAVGDEVGALAAADMLLDGRRVPALTVSFDVLDEIELDHRAALVLGCVDGMTSLSRVLTSCGLARVDALRTVCELVERRILVLRAPR